MPVDDSIKLAAWKICSRIDFLISKIPTDNQLWTPEMLDAAKRDALNHHAAHIVKMNIQQKKLDHNKLLSWYGFILVRQAFEQHKGRFAPLNLVILEMNRLLKASHSSNDKLSSIFMSDLCLSELRRLAERDGTDDEFAIGKNGLYTAFRSATEMKNRLNALILEGSLIMA